jgi:hypothetical protein
MAPHHLRTSDQSVMCLQWGASQRDNPAGSTERRGKPLGVQGSHSAAPCHSPEPFPEPSAPFHRNRGGFATAPSAPGNSGRAGNLSVIAEPREADRVYLIGLMSEKATETHQADQFKATSCSRPVADRPLTNASIPHADLATRALADTRRLHPVRTSFRSPLGARELRRPQSALQSSTG